jgi:hypothetical protein
LLETFRNGRVAKGSCCLLPAYTSLLPAERKKLSDRFVADTNELVVEPFVTL